MIDLKNLDWHETLEKIQGYASSLRAKEIILNTRPHKSADLAQKQVHEIVDATQVVSLDFRPSIESLDTYHTWFERLRKKATLRGPEFQDIRRFCFDVISLQKTLSSFQNTWTQSTFKKLLDPTKILSSIDQIFTYEGEIRSDASETLYKLFNEKRSLEKQIRNTLDKFVKAYELEHMLQDKYVTNREGRWVLPVKSGKQHQFDGIIHDASQTKQTVFMEPREVIAINNRLKEVEGDIEKEIERLLVQLTHYVSGFSDPIEIAQSTLLEADVRLAQAQFCLKIQGSTFEFSETHLRLEELRHPLLSFQSVRSIVSNTVEFEPGKRILILSGPNAGGKTVLLKAIGLAAQMARCGLPLPAFSTSQIPFFKNIVIGIGDTQSVGEHMSTFAAHLKVLSKALEATGPHDLILIDEICGSTDPEEGAAIARSFIEHYAAQGVYAVITSHLGPLKQIWPQESPIICGSMEFHEKPTYKLFMGIHGRSFALKTAKSAGVPESVISKAMSFLSQESRTREENLDELEAYKEQVAVLSEKLKTETQLMEMNKNKYKDLLKKFEIEKKVYLEKAVERAEKKLEKLIEEFRSNPNVSKIKTQFPEVIKSTGAAKSVLTIEDFQKQFPPGSSAYIVTLGQDGIIQGLPNAKGDVTVLSRSMRLQVHWKDIRSSQSAMAQIPVPQKLSMQQLPQDEVEVDLRGMTTDQAIDELEKVLDKALQDQVDQIKIIHGHGTEVLKKSIRNYLSRSVYIQKWKAGSVGGNDDGVTFAVLS